MKTSPKRLGTLAVHAGRRIDPATGAIAQPIYTSTTFERDTDGGFSRGYSYQRDANPNRAALEGCLAALDGGEMAAAFSTGMAAAFAVLQALSPGDHVVVHRDIYYGVRALLEGIFSRWGLRHTFVDMRNNDELRRACGKETKLLWLESPSNPMLEVVDIERAAKAARDAQAWLVCENTFASPVLQAPIGLGADVVVYSLTKYHGGHSDVMGGAVVCREATGISERIRQFQHEAGAILAPFECWLVLRGIETLVPRLQAHCANARKIADFLSTHKAVAKVHYPGLASHAGHEIAKRQMRDFGGMVSLEIRGGREEAFAFVSRLRLIARATSLGGTHTLIEHRASIEGTHTRAPESLLRLSVGVEDADDLIQDLEQALHQP